MSCATLPAANAALTQNWDRLVGRSNGQRTEDLLVTAEDTLEHRCSASTS
jgi:hypothetical protein